MRVIVIALSILSAGAALAFDVAIVGNDGPCSPVLPNTTRFLRWVDGQTNTSSGQMYVVAATPGGRFIGIREAAGGTSEVVSVRPDQPPVPLGTVVIDGRPEAMVANAAGELFVVVEQLPTGASHVLRITQTGELLATYPLPTPEGHYTGMDLAADQCTLFVSSAGSVVSGFDVGAVWRLNVCTGASDLLIFTTTGEYGFSDVKVLEGGDLLVAEGSALVRYTAAGVPVGTIATPGESGEPVDHIALTRGGRSAYLSYHCYGPLREWNLGTGTLHGGLDYGVDVTTSLIAVNGWTAAFGHISLTDVPTLSEVLLFGLAGLLSLLGLRRLSW
ncbi:MAG TPA: hypothetical protein VEK57_17700 [Thermoanaerobaculia bacterium]|nr:hypothetical protein [Thermoanaerobaculia bacterium]